MTVLFGHPSGNPNSHHAALAHFEAGRLEAFCVPWMPSPQLLRAMEKVPGLGPMARRLARRYFAPLADAPKRQGRLGEINRLLLRALGRGSEGLSYQANDWLMRTMAGEAHRKAVTAVHAYEDCSLLQFEEARRRDKACIYDMPIGYYPAWQRTQAELARKYADWLPSGGLSSSRYARPEQKKAEMACADLVLAPSLFVQKTIKDYHPGKRVVHAPYGVDLDFWQPAANPPARERLTFIYGGQISVRKGMPDLLEAWRHAGLEDARLVLVGLWQLSEEKQNRLPANVTWRPPCGPGRLRAYFDDADVFVMPSHFEGFSLALLEAMACGLVPLASDVTGIADMASPSFGRVIPAGDAEALVTALRWASDNRDLLPAMGRAARKQVERYSWDSYRRHVRDAVAPFV